MTDRATRFSVAVALASLMSSTAVFAAQGPPLGLCGKLLEILGNAGVSQEIIAMILAHLRCAA